MLDTENQLYFERFNILSAGIKIPNESGEIGNRVSLSKSSIKI